MRAPFSSWKVALAAFVMTLALTILADVYAPWFSSLSSFILVGCLVSYVASGRLKARILEIRREKWLPKKRKASANRKRTQPRKIQNPQVEYEALVEHHRQALAAKMPKLKHAPAAPPEPQLEPEMITQFEFEQTSVQESEPEYPDEYLSEPFAPPDDEQLSEQFPATKPEPVSTIIGLTTAECPYCEHQLAKMPGRKKKCPACNKFIYVRTRPQDRVRILVREDQLSAVEEQWDIIRPFVFIGGQDRLETTKQDLRERFGHEPSRSDVQWALFNGDAMISAAKMDWGVYRNVRFWMAEFIFAERRITGALNYLYEVVYLDLNGPNNCGGIREFPHLLREFPPFDPRSGDLAPAVVGRIGEIADSMGRPYLELESDFMAVAMRIGVSLRLPVPPAEAWQKLKTELESQIQCDET